MKRHPLRDLTLLVIVLTGTLLALPNVFPSEPALIVSPEIGAKEAAPLEPATIEAVRRTLRNAAVMPTLLRPGESIVTVRFADEADQQAASRALAADLPGHVVSLTRATLIAAIVLMMFGSGPIQGFVVTLSLGIMTPMLTAIVGTRAIVDRVFAGKSPKRLSIGGRKGAVDSS